MSITTCFSAYTSTVALIPGLTQGDSTNTVSARKMFVINNSTLVLFITVLQGTSRRSHYKHSSQVQSGKDEKTISKLLCRKSSEPFIRQRTPLDQAQDDSILPPHANTCVCCCLTDDVRYCLLPSPCSITLKQLPPGTDTQLLSAAARTPSPLRLIRHQDSRTASMALASPSICATWRRTFWLSLGQDRIARGRTRRCRDKRMAFLILRTRV